MRFAETTYSTSHDSTDGFLLIRAIIGYRKTREPDKTLLRYAIMRTTLSQGLNDNRWLCRPARVLGLCLSALLGLLLVPEAVFARAGGGGGFGGGGGGGSGDGGSGELIVWLIWLCIRHPQFGIPLTLALLALMFFGGKQANEQRISHTIRRGVQRQKQSLLTAGAETIRQHDPAFDVEQFLERAGAAFRKIQEGWSHQQIDSCRTFISDGIRERFSLQFEMQRAEGLRNRVDNVDILHSDVVAIFSDGQFDTLHVRFHASAVDYDVSLQSGREIGGTRRPGDFVEIWSFHRRPGAKTINQPGAIEGRCPRCTSPVTIVDQAKCRACGAQVNSGEFDWVLAEITQECEWSVPGNVTTIEGLGPMKHSDPAFSIQHIEDRVSVMFWRLRAAEFYFDLDQVLPVVSPRYREQFQQHLSELQQSSKFWNGPAVGRVEIVDVIPAVDHEFDLVRVKVRWSGTLRKGERGGSSRVVRPQAIYTDVFSLTRRRGVKSVAQSAFASAGCPSCGAPIAVSASGACTYCQTTITDGCHDWVLDDVAPYSADLAFLRDLSERTHSAGAEADASQSLMASGDSELSLAVLARVMFADGDISPEERRALQRMGAHRKIPPAEVDLIIQSAGMAATKIPEPRDAVEAMQHLKQIVHVVMADGNINRQEQQLLKRYADHVGLAAADVNQAIKQERRRMYQEARAVLNQSRTMVS